ncbi:hypothetical protein ACWEP4_23940 [Streptomyces sp. NPDC004227]
MSAVLTDDAAKAPPAASGYDDGRVWAAVRWTGMDGSPHTGQAKVFPDAPAGTRLAMWADRAGHVVSAPVTGTEAPLQAALTGALAAPSAGAAVWAAGWVIRTRQLPLGGVFVRVEGSAESVSSADLQVPDLCRHADRQGV